jgi:hypothetical protein
MISLVNEIEWIDQLIFLKNFEMKLLEHDAIKSEIIIKIFNFVLWSMFFRLNIKQIEHFDKNH